MTGTRKIAGWFAIVMGIGLIGMWGMFLATGNVPELETEPYSIAFHLAAEFLTGLTLLVGGYGLLAGRRWGPGAHLVSLGMLLYAVVQAPGYFAQQGEIPFVAMFGVFIILTVAFIGLGLRGLVGGSTRP